MCSPRRSDRQARRDMPSNFNLAAMQSSHEDAFFMAKCTDTPDVDAINLSSF